jgi:hypothetical protein
MAKVVCTVCGLESPVEPYREEIAAVISSWGRELLSPDRTTLQTKKSEKS